MKITLEITTDELYLLEEATRVSQRNSVEEFILQTCHHVATMLVEDDIIKTLELKEDQ